MPIYEYYCPSCEKKFEELVFETRVAVVHCPKCGTNEVNRLISLFATAASSGNMAQMSGEGSGHSPAGCGCGSCSCGHG
jgi:putative FmdB family regulatory protein